MIFATIWNSRPRKLATYFKSKSLSEWRVFFRKTKRPKRAVYTCLFGYSEFFCDFAYDKGDVDFICFTDDPELRSSFWDIRLVKSPLLDPGRASKRIKILAHRFLAQYDQSLYLDNTIRLKQRPHEMFDEILNRSSSPLSCIIHPFRECVYAEAEAVIGIGYDTAARVNEQMSLYRRLGYPANAGLTQSGFMLRRHNDPVLATVMETWFEQVLKYSVRDQLSFKVAAWIHDLDLDVLNIDFANNDILEWPVAMGPRLPRDFDDGRYLQLNPDVAEAGVNARMHFLRYGITDGRQYK